jgi:hypothetical protein
MPQFDFYVTGTLSFYISIAFSLAFAILLYFMSSRIQLTLEIRKKLVNINKSSRDEETSKVWNEIMKNAVKL